DRQRGQEVTTCGPDVFTGCQDRPQIVAGVTGFSLGQIAIIEIEVADQRTVVERSSVNVSEPTANQGTVARATQLINVSAYHSYRLPMECRHTPTQSIQNTDLELLAAIGSQSFKSCSAREGRHLLHLAHKAFMYGYTRS